MHPSDQRNGHNTGPDMELLSRDRVTTSIRLRLKSQNPVLYMLKQDTVASVDRCSQSRLRLVGSSVS